MGGAGTGTPDEPPPRSVLMSGKFSSEAPRHNPGAGTRPLATWGLPAGRRELEGVWGEQTFLPALGDPDVEIEAVLFPVGAVLGDGGLQASLLEVLGLQGSWGRPEGLG